MKSKRTIITISDEDKLWLSDPATSVEVLAEGPLRATLQVQRQILNSSYTQCISLTHNSPQIDFETTIDWDESKVLLKVIYRMKKYYLMVGMPLVM